MLVEIECITTAQNQATTEVVAVVENRNQILFGSGALDLAETSSFTTQTAQVEQLRTANLV
jgi:hypothetical protein